MDYPSSGIVLKGGNATASLGGPAHEIGEVAGDGDALLEMWS